MLEVQKYFDLEIDDFITFFVGRHEHRYPMTFTVGECIEEYCGTHGLDLVKIVEDIPTDGQIRSGIFFCANYARLSGDATGSVGETDALFLD